MSKVNLTVNGEVFEAEKGQPLIDIAQENDMPIIFGCRNGACGACLVKVKEGKENLSPMSDDEKDFLLTMNPGLENDGNSEDEHFDERLACQAQINGDIVLETLD